VTEADLETLVELPITPLGLAGIYLGEDVDSVVRRVGEPGLRHPASDEPDEIAEILEYGPFVVVGHAGRVAALWALEGYRGRTIGGIGVGMPWLELTRRWPEVAFDDVRHGWAVPGWPFLSLEISRPSRGDEAEVDGPWTEEWYEVSDPERAFVSLISLSLEERPRADERESE
jgi:hypothetical protein